MTLFAALLRAVNVGGRKLLMADLKTIADDLGLERALTYIASGNLLFSSDSSEARLKPLLEERLAKHMGAAVPVLIRTADELEHVVQANPFPGEPGNRVAVIFLDRPAPADTGATARNVGDERIEVGGREVYVAYGEHGMGRSRLQLPAAGMGTARNMNTVAKMAELTRKIA